MWQALCPLSLFLDCHGQFLVYIKVPWKFGDPALLVDVSTSSSTMDMASGMFVLQWHLCEREQNFHSRHLKLQETYEIIKSSLQF